MTSPFERGAIDGLVSHLRNSSREVELICIPEDNEKHPLTVDGELQIDGERWAVDHMRVSRDSMTIPATTSIEKLLKPMLDEFARERNVTLFVTLHPPRLAQNRQAAQTFRDSVLVLAREAVEDLGALKHDKNHTFVRALTETCMPGSLISVWGDDDPLVENQVRKGIRDPLLKKFNKQLRNARDLGWKTILLLDQMDDPCSKHPSIWCALPGTIGIVVDQVIKEANFGPSEVWLRTGAGTYLCLLTAPFSPRN